MTELNILSADEIPMHNPKIRIEVDGQYISLYPAGNSIMSEIGYNIERSRCRTPEKILGWIEHLSGKNWMNAEAVNDFAQTAFGLLGIEPDRTL